MEKKKWARLDMDNMRRKKGVFKLVHQPFMIRPQMLFQEPGDTPAIHYIVLSAH